MLLLADDQDPDEELVALAALKLAKQERQSNKFGHRGPYDCSKSTDFLHCKWNYEDEVNCYPEGAFSKWSSIGDDRFSSGPSMVCALTT